LTPTQEQELWETLKATPGANVRIIATGNVPEVHLYAEQIRRVFRAAQWNVQSLDAGAGSTMEGAIASSPVSLSLYKYEDDHACEVAIQAFRNAKITISLKEGELPYSGPTSLVMSWPKASLGIQVGVQQ
jgi:hypothetical protein